MTQRPEKTTQSTGRVHPDEQSRIAALNSAGQVLRGVVSEQKPPTSYYTPELIQVTLPHSDPKTRDWKKTNGNFTLIVSSGVDENLEAYGIPYGAFPRLVLAYIITEVIKNGSRRVHFSSYFSAFLHELGYSKKTNRRGDTEASRVIKGQLLRLLRASITFQYSTGDEKSGLLAVKDVKIAPEFALWWNFKEPDQGSLFGSYIDISEDFHNAILRAPVPLHKDILAALRKSALALDIYMWVSYRLFTLHINGQDQVTIGYGRMQEQFGTSIAEKNYRQFRSEFKLAFEKVAAHWKSADGEKELLNYELRQDNFTLYRSPLLIKVPKRKASEIAAEEEATRILANRKFDDVTMKQARQMAGTEWDVHWLAKQYFVWIEQETIVPKNPCSHFLAFIKSHRERNEK